jgi:hypothetical protein
MRSLAADEDFTALESPMATRIVGLAARWGTTLAFLALFAYCTRTAWGVLCQLGHVTLAEGLEAFRVVSVRDAILCVVGYQIGKELLAAVLRNRRPRA